jgi:DNA-binding NarL/FixJ family response regulator
MDDVMHQELMGRHDASELIEGLVMGRWIFAGRGWDEDVRMFRFAPCDAPRPLTPVERRVLALLSRGAANAEMGYVLGSRNSTVATHVANLARRLNAQVLDLIALGPLLEQVVPR